MSSVGYKLYALTSCFVPNPLTDRTGTEDALYCLQEKHPPRVEGAQDTEYGTTSWKTYMLLEAELLLLSLATGIQDAAVWIDYALFASNQTGNLLFLAIAAAGFTRSNKDVRNIAVSLRTFVGGALIFGQLGNYFGPRKRLWLILSNILQTVMVYGAAIIWYTVPNSAYGPAARGVITLLAVSSGAQVAMGRSLRITEITIATATSVFADAVVDPQLIQLENRRRNRRVLFLVMLTGRCLAGAFAQKGVNSAFAILLCAIVKSIVTGAFFFNKDIPKSDVNSAR